MVVEMSFFSELAGSAIASFGEATQINSAVTLQDGATPIFGVWSQAQPSRVQLFLNEKDWAMPAYDVTLPISVMDAPISLAYGSEIVRLNRLWKAVVRHIETPDDGTDECYCQALVVLLPR